MKNIAKLKTLRRITILNLKTIRITFELVIYKDLNENFK